MTRPWAIVLSTLLLAGAAGAQQTEPPPQTVPPPADAPPQEETRTTRGEDYRGFAGLYRVRALTVVYPAGAGEDVAVNRRSAELRAARLHSLSGATTRVVADADATASDLAEHVLVLGWTNRVLGTKEVPRPFTYSRDDGVSFLGVSETDPREDLMFMARSPFNPERMLFFWSRIDPEMDRFQALPTVGSDWALFDRFRVVRQGMFVPGKTWPPVRDEEAEGDHREVIRVDEAGLVRKTTEHYVVAYDSKAVTADEATRIAAAREAALAQAVSRLGDPGKGFRIALFVHADTEAKARRTGIADPAHSIPRERELHMTKEVALGTASHEETHLVARQVLGPCYLTTFYEGLALAHDGEYLGTPLDLVAAMMLERNAWPKLADVLDEVGARKLSENQRFPASGLLVSWIETELGRGALTRAFTGTEGTVESLARHVGRPPEQIEPAFRKWVEGRAASRRQDLAFVNLQKEAAERHVAGDWPGLVSTLVRSLELRPRDAQTLFNLASARMRTKEYAKAEQDLRKLIAQEAGARDSMFLVFGHYQLGRVHDLQGHREMALAEYRRVLELPDQKDVHRLAREAIAVPVTEEQLQ